MATMLGAQSAFSPLCHWLAVVDGGVKIWSRDGLFSEMAGTWSCSAWCTMKVRKNLKLFLALGSKDGTVSMWDPVKREIMWETKDLHSRAVVSLCFARRQQSLYFAVADGGKVQKVDACSGEAQGKIRIPARAVSAMAVSRGGGLLVVAVRKRLILYDLKKMEKIRILAKNFSATALAFMRKKRFILAASKESRLCVFKTVARRKALLTFPLKHPAVAVDSRWPKEEGGYFHVLAVTEAGEADVWSATSLRHLAKAKHTRICVSAQDHNLDCIHAAQFIDSSSLYVARGTATRCSFEEVKVEAVSETAEPQNNKKRARSRDSRQLLKRVKPSSLENVVSPSEELPMMRQQEGRQQSEFAQALAEANGYKFKWYTNEEDEIIKQTAIDAVKAAGWPPNEGLQRLLGLRECSNKEETRQKFRCWDLIKLCLPYRKPKSVRARAARVLNGFVKRGKWSPEEVKCLERLVVKFGNDWKLIGKELGRDRMDARSKWHYLKNQRCRGPWSPEETMKLCQLVHENLASNKRTGKESKCKQILGLNWASIANDLGTRAASSCIRKWHDILASKKLKTGEWDPDDDESLLSSLLHSEVVDEECIEWDKLLPHRSKETCQERWNEMVRALGSQHKNKRFVQKMELLMKRYVHFEGGVELLEQQPFTEEEAARN